MCIVAGILKERREACKATTEVRSKITHLLLCTRSLTLGLPFTAWATPLLVAESLGDTGSMALGVEGFAGPPLLLSAEGD